MLREQLVVGLIELWLDPTLARDSARGYLQFVAGMASHASSYVGQAIAQAAEPAASAGEPPADD
jgi:hypothetical protein